MTKPITKQIANFLSLFSQDVVSQITPENKTDATYPDFLHISRNPNIKSMIPRISERQMKREDRTIPRVVGAPTLLGCICGYATMLDDQGGFKKATRTNDVWLNGYYIYEVDYDWRFKPNDKLVPDQSVSDETWLLNYNQDNKEYKPKHIGKFFITQIVQDFTKSKSRSNYTSRVHLYIQIDREVSLSENIKLGKGYWEVSIPYITEINSESISWTKDKDITYSKLEVGDYHLKKKLTANLLGYEETNPFQF